MQNVNQTNPNSAQFSQQSGSQPSQTSSQFFTNATGPSQGSETNPFVSDLRGEFSSNFGTNTGSVSQIFKEGGYSQNNTKKWIIIALVAVVCILAVVYLLDSSSDSKVDEEFAEAEDAVVSGEQDTQVSNEATASTEGEQGAEQPADQGAASTEQANATPEQPAETEAPAQQEVAAPTEQVAQRSYEQPATPTGNIEILSVAEGARWDYDETTGPVTFSWGGAKGGTIVFARNANMHPAIMKVPVSGNSYEFYNPYPGTWYWRVDSASGSSEVRSFTVNPPIRRNVSLQTPVSGGVLAANGGEISWTEDTKVAFYRVEFSADGSWATPAYKYATSGTKLSTQNINPGTYQLRIGAFSEVAGRWEYTTPISVNVQ